MNKTTTQQLILEAVINCIEKYGVEKTTTRKIAQEAGTNIASINYYFRSKDELITRALDVTLQHMQEDLATIIQDTEQSFDEKLHACMVFLMEGAVQFPNVFMAHMYPPMVEKNYNTQGVETFRGILEMLVSQAIQAFPKTSTADLRFALEEVLSAMIFKKLSPGFFAQGSSSSAEELADKYIMVFNNTIANP